MTDTPETDHWFETQPPTLLLARRQMEKLERERDQLRRWTSTNGVRELEKERDQLRNERDMARAAANSFRQCAEITFGAMPFPRKFHWENQNQQKQP